MSVNKDLSPNKQAKEDEKDLMRFKDKRELNLSQYRPKGNQNLLPTILIRFEKDDRRESRVRNKKETYFRKFSKCLYKSFKEHFKRTLTRSGESNTLGGHGHARDTDTLGGHWHARGTGTR